MEFRILGPLEVRGDARVELGTPKQRTLLALLLIRANEAVSVERLIDGLWEDDPPRTVRHTLQGYIHRLRQALGPEAWRLETRPAGYELKVSDDELDARRFERLAADGHRALVRGDLKDATRLLSDGLGLWRGPLLADLPNVRGLEAERARLEAVRLAALEDRVEAALSLGDHRRLVGELEALVEEHPFRERLWGQLMLALYRCGRQADALSAFQRARRTLAEELGVEPGPWLRRRQELILLQDPSLEAPETRPHPRPPHNLPTRRTGFVGRRRELLELAGLLHAGRLVTITGPPGVGKTRLALAVADRVLEEHAHGVFLVTLAEVDDPELVPAAIAAALGLAVTDQPPIERLIDHVRTRRLLLVLDNFEHLRPAAAVIARLLDAGRGLTVLATSRAPLRLSGEQEYPLAPMSLPGTGGSGNGAGGSEAMTLFVQRARAVDPSFDLDADTASGVAEVVARLDGLPLAIELAAARLRTSSLTQLRGRLGPALPVLTGGPVDRPPRQRTLRNAISWSEQLLGAGERALLARLAVFRGGFTREAADAVAGGAPVIDVAAGLDALVEASLLQRPDEDAPDRFTMLTTIRDYARERLVAAGEQDQVARRHFEFFARLVEQAEPQLTRTDQAAWLCRLDDEHSNLRAALNWARQAGHTDLALDMAGRMWRFWQLRGHFVEGRRWLEDLLDARPAPGPARARALIGLAGICYWQFDLETAQAAYEEALDIARDFDQWWLEFEALLGLVGTIACHRGDPEQAAPFEQQFQALVAEHPEPMVISYGQATSMLMRLFTGDLEGAREYGEQVLAGARAAGERWYETQTLRTLGLVSLLEEQPGRAEDELIQSLEIAHEIEDPVGLAMDLDRLGQAAIAHGHFERALVLAGAASRLRESVTGGLTLDDFRRQRQHPLEAARSVLTDERIEVASARGRTMSLQDVIDYAHTPSADRQRAADPDGGGEPNGWLQSAAQDL